MQKNAPRSAVSGSTASRSVEKTLVLFRKIKICSKKGLSLDFFFSFSRERGQLRVLLLDFNENLVVNVANIGYVFVCVFGI